MHTSSGKLGLGAVLFLSAVLANGQLMPEARSQQYNEGSQAAATPQSKAADKQSASGHISGTILDQTGAVTVGAKVRLTGKNLPSSREVVSGANGQFSFSRVPPGPFQLTITAPGFATQVFSGELASGQTDLVPAIVLPIAAAETVVDVAEPVPTVETAEIQIKEQEKQRVLAFIPNYYVSYVHDAAPLNARQKFELAWKTAVDPVTFLGAGLYAGFEQAGNRYPEYGQGAQGYAKRYGAGYADAAAGIFIGNAILPSLLKTRPTLFLPRNRLNAIAIAARNLKFRNLQRRQQALAAELLIHRGKYRGGRNLESLRPRQGAQWSWINLRKRADQTWSGFAGRHSPGIRGAPADAALAPHDTPTAVSELRRGHSNAWSPGAVPESRLVTSQCAFGIA